MKYFGLGSLCIVLFIGVVWITSSFSGTEYVNESGETEKLSYQNVLDSAQDAADSISQAGTVSIEIYDGITYTPDTTIADLSGRNLSGSLKAEIRKLSKLEVLDLRDNDFTGLPAEVGQLSALKTLNLSNNPLTGLPREIGQLQNLQLLDVSGTQYSTQDLTAIEAQLPSATVVVTR
jgi:Leucine-rich repeat (LRR) protein